MDRDLEVNFNLAKKGNKQAKIALANEVFDVYSSFVEIKQGRIHSSSDEATQILDWMLELTQEENLQALMWHALLCHHQQDYEHAINFFLRAIKNSIQNNQPNLLAFAYVGYYYACGYGIEKNLDNAKKHASFAFDKGEKKVSSYVLAWIIIEIMKKGETRKDLVNDLEKYLKISIQSGNEAAMALYKTLFGE